MSAKKINHSIFNLSYDLILGGRNFGRINLHVGGIHNLMNSLAAITVTHEIGLDIPVIQEGLSRFFLPERRFQVLFFDQNNLVIDDYAHHPTEIAATIKMARSGSFKRLIVVFQPHRFTRLTILMKKFSTAFTGADILIVTKLYAAGQKKIKNISSHSLAENIKKTGIKQVHYLESFQEILQFLNAEVRKGDAVAFLSAGDLTSAAHQYGKMLEKTRTGDDMS